MACGFAHGDSLSVWPLEAQPRQARGLVALDTMGHCTTQALQRPLRPDCSLFKAPLLPNQEILKEGCPSLPESTLAVKEGRGAGKQATGLCSGSAGHTRTHTHRHR